MKDLIYSDVPSDWALCFQTSCPLADTCLRHHAATLLPADVRHHNAVCPQARTADACSMYVSDTPVQIAIGMTHITDGYNPWDARDIKQQLFECFGSRTHYYRYRNGEYPIPPAKQQEVADIFRRLGHTKPPVFDHLKEAYYFPLW